MKHNVLEKGRPTGAWATASRSPEGVFGVTIGVGADTVAFIPEARLSDYLIAALQVDGDDGLTAMVAAAASTLPAFKGNIARHLKRSAKAASN